jgi:hypothetical protein
VLVGTGWGALEGALRREHGDAVDYTGTPFSDDSLTAEQRPWLDLLQGRGFSGAASYVAGAGWETPLSQQPDTVDTLLHRGFLSQAAGRAAEARELYLRVLTRGDSALARRGLAQADLAAGERTAAGDNYVAACTLEPTNRSLLVEAVSALLAADQPDRALGLLQQTDGPQGADGRLQLLRAWALARVGCEAEAAAILRAGVEVADIREGENSISRLWQSVCPGEDVPAAYQFSMG